VTFLKHPFTNFYSKSSTKSEKAVDFERTSREVPAATLEVGYLASRLGSLLLISRHANVAEVRILLSLCVQSNDRAILELTLHKSANLAIQQL
jgi:hypothetical protein